MQLALHDAEVALEDVTELLEALDAVALLLLDLHGAREALPNEAHLVLVHVEEVLVEHVDFGVHALDQALDVLHLVGQLANVLFGRVHRLDVAVVLL